jgi:hypothetical protein
MIADMSSEREWQQQSVSLILNSLWSLTRGGVCITLRTLLRGAQMAYDTAVLTGAGCQEFLCHQCINKTLLKMQEAEQC